MRVGHGAPGLGEGLGVDRRGGLRGGRGHGFEAGRGGRGLPLADDAAPGLAVGGLAHVDLVHSGAVPVEELQAGQDLVAGVLRQLGHGQAGVPLVEEQAQVDVFAEGQADGALARELLVHAGLLVHHALVAREREQRPAGLERLQQRQPFGLERDGARGTVGGADVRGQGRAFAHADGGGRVAGAKALGARGLVGGPELVGVHVVSPWGAQKSVTSATDRLRPGEV